MSLLLANGHPEADDYPLGYLGDEAKLIADRLNGQIVTEAVLLQAAAASIMSKEGGKLFTKLIENLQEG